MTRFILRNARLTVWKPRPTPQSPLGAFFGAAIPNAVEIDADNGLRIQWQIDKAIGSTPNTAKIVVTNLAEKTRAEFQDLPRTVLLEVGFDGQLEHLFSGDVRHANHEHIDGTTWETTLEVADGGRAYLHARIVRAFGPGTPAVTVIRETATALGLSLPAAVETKPELQKQFTQGWSFAGRASDAMSELLAPFGLSWSIQDGSLLLQAGGEVRAGQAVVIEEGAGMIGSPAFAPPAAGKPKGKPVLKVASMVYPQVTPGGVIDVRSKRVNGQFKALRVSHRGDSHGPATTEIEAQSR